MPRQERARFTASAILRATVEVIDDVGWERASTNLIAERAGVSIGTLYQYFDSKDTLLANLIEQHHRAIDEALGSVMARYSPEQPLDQMVRTLFNALIGLHQRDPVLTRVLADGVPRIRSRQAHEGRDVQFVELLRQLLEQRSDTRLRQTTAAAFILVNVLESLTRWIAHNAPDFLSKDELIDEVAVMLAGYVTHQFPDDTSK